MEIGIITHLTDKENNFARVTQLGLNVCQLSCWDMHLATKEMAARIIQESSRAQVRVCAVWAGVPGPQV